MSKPRILCVDDQASNLQIRAMLLEQFGCSVVTAFDHQDALRAIADGHLDLAIIDYHLAKGETGEQIAQDIRIMAPEVRLVMLTGDSRLPQSAADIVDAVLIKGASDPRALFDVIQSLLPEAELHSRRPMLVKEPRATAPKLPDQPNGKAS